LLICALAIANRVRRRFLPEVLAAHVEAGRLYPLAARWVSVELLASVCIVGLASQLSQTTPAAHDLSYWWLPVRISAAATWPIASTQVVVSVAILVLVLEAFWIVRQRHRPTIKRRGLWLYVATATAAAGLALWKLSVPAYPDTYLRSTVPYLTVSIVQGKHHFERYCADCHGAGGLGDGPSAGRLPRPPADLSLPHTALHTVGDMFWWISHGIPESGMPSFAGDLDEQARWDVTNFLRAFSQGFEARLLSPVILADQPWLGAPDFYYEDREGVPQELKNFRELSNVLLVFPSQSAGEALGRLRDLARAQDQLRANKLEVIVVNAKALAEDEGGLVQVGNGAEEIREAYDLLSRNLTNRGSGRSLSLDRKHMEFLIDRFGYIRGRWIPEDEPEGWDKIESLEREVLRLNAEPRLRPPPDDHVH
jgi:putative copper resistance protein D